MYLCILPIKPQWFSGNLLRTDSVLILSMTGRLLNLRRLFAKYLLVWPVYSTLFLRVKVFMTWHRDVRTDSQVTIFVNKIRPHHAGASSSSLAFIPPENHWLWQFISISAAITYLADDCLAISTIAGKRHFRSARTGLLSIPRIRTTLRMRNFAVAGPLIWNSLPAALRTATLSSLTFARHMKAHLFGWSIARLRVIYDALYKSTHQYAILMPVLHVTQPRVIDQLTWSILVSVVTVIFVRFLIHLQVGYPQAAYGINIRGFGHCSPPPEVSPRTFPPSYNYL